MSSGDDRGSLGVPPVGLGLHGGLVAQVIDGRDAVRHDLVEREDETEADECEAGRVLALGAAIGRVARDDGVSAEGDGGVEVQDEGDEGEEGLEGVDGRGGSVVGPGVVCGARVSVFRAVRRDFGENRDWVERGAYPGLRLLRFSMKRRRMATMPVTMRKTPRV